MQNKSLSSPNRLPIEGLAILLFKTLYSWGRALWAIFLVVFLRINKHPEVVYYLYIALGIIVFISIIHSILTYKNFYFQIKDDAFIVQKGYINKENKSVPLERIQTVNIKQNILQQILGIVQLDIDSAGSKGKEISLPGVRIKQAKELESILLSKKNDTVITEEQENIEDKEEKKILLYLSVKDLVKIAISDNMLKGGLLALSFGYGLFSQYKDILEERFSNELENVETSITSAGWDSMLIFLLLFLIISVIISVTRNILINYNLKLSLTSQGYKIEKGLFNKRSVILPINKIQTYTWNTNPLRKIFNIVTISVKQASSEEVKENNAINIPGCYEDIEQSLKNKIFPEHNTQEYVSEKTKAIYFLRLIPLLVLIVFIVVLIITNLKIAIITSIIWTSIISVLLYKSSKKRVFYISKDYLITQKGTIGITKKIVSLYKIQSVKYKQSIFMKRKNRASLKIYTASETINIPFINEVSAKETYDYILYKIENKNIKWM